MQLYQKTNQSKPEHPQKLFIYYNENTFLCQWLHFILLHPRENIVLLT